jgi:hypothetical protein
MKKFISTLLYISIVLLFGITANAEKPVFDETQWADVFAGASIVGSTEGVVLSGKGYSTDASNTYRFLTRHIPPYDITNSSITVKFPETFEGCDYNQYPDFTYLIGFCATLENWINDSKSVVFVLRPRSNSELEVMLSGNDGVIGWTDTSVVKEPLMVKLGVKRTITLSLKKTKSKTIALVNGEELGALTKNAQASVDSFRKNRCFIKIGATTERDIEKKFELKVTITDLTGKMAVVSNSSAPVSSNIANSTSSENTLSTTSSSLATSSSESFASIPEIDNQPTSSNASNIAVIILAIVILVTGTGIIVTYILLNKKKH